jgi:hypothetical protein
VRGLSVLSGVIAFAASACAVPFSDADFAPYRGDGAAILEGQAYVELAGTVLPNLRTCFGEPVFLAPATGFDRFVITTAVDGHPVDDAAGPAAPYWRKATCDSQGRFTFSDVPSGDWYAVTQVTWSVRSEPYQVSKLVRRVTLRPGQNVVVMSSRGPYFDLWDGNPGTN